MKTFDRRLSVTLCALLIFALLGGLCLPSFAAGGFAYAHNPLENPSSAADIVADENAVYGYRPGENGSLSMYASADWSDPAIVESGRADRIKYHKSIESMYTMLRDMQKQGKSTEEIARAVSTRRNEIRLEAYADNPEGLAELKARNLATYGHEEGPLPDELYEKYGSWETVIKKAFNTNAGMDACLGLYDDYYFLYAAQGDVPADISVSLPDDVICRVKKTITLNPVTQADCAYTVSFASSDPGIAQVSENGTVTGIAPGEAEIFCVVTDPGGFTHTAGPCKVTVKYTFLQWIIMTFLFGKYWYK